MRCNIYNLRMSKGFGSTRKLAKVCDMTHSEICRLENNDVRNPSIVTCYKIARALDVTIDELFTFDEGEENVVVKFDDYNKNDIVTKISNHLKKLSPLLDCRGQEYFSNEITEYIERMAKERN